MATGLWRRPAPSRSAPRSYGSSSGIARSARTGLAQIRGYRGTVHQPDDLSRRLQADLEYINGWSIWRDIVILFKTFNVVVHPNAY